MTWRERLRGHVCTAVDVIERCGHLGDDAKCRRTLRNYKPGRYASGWIYRAWRDECEYQVGERRRLRRVPHAAGSIYKPDRRGRPQPDARAQVALDL